MKTVSTTIIPILFAFAGFLYAEDGFVPLMTAKPGTAWTDNAKPLDGWVKYGGRATFEVDRNGEIVGKRGPRGNTFLCTEKRYSNFILKFEFKYDIPVNSGVQFRSSLQGNPPAGWNGIVMGYQCEIDYGTETGLTGCIYDESRRRRWLEPPTDDVKNRVAVVQKADKWNELIVQCVGPSIKTWLNGVKIDDLMDIASHEGFVGLQVHSAPEGQLRWRNIRIKELPATPWIALYTDKQFSADIEIKPVGQWTIEEDGAVYGTSEVGEKRDGLIVSKSAYKDFAVKVSFKATVGNSGLYFRALDVDKPYWLEGYQCDVAIGEPCSGLWEVQRRGWVAKNEALAAETYRADDWNDVGTVAVGDHLVTFLNGRKIVDVVDIHCIKEGKTGLQLHGGGNQGFRFRDYYIMPLDEAAVKLIAQ